MENNKLSNALKSSICVVLVTQLVGCGTIFYPERKGQKSGRLDIGVVLLDGLGLFFFLIPGIIAYAVDFSNGTIYLPGTSMSSLDLETMQEVKFDPKHTSIADLERIIKEQTGKTVKMDETHAIITKLRSTKEMMIQFAQTLPVLHDDRIVLTR